MQVENGFKLAEAALEGDLVQVKNMLAANADVDFQDSFFFFFVFGAV